MTVRPSIFFRCKFELLCLSIVEYCYVSVKCVNIFIAAITRKTRIIDVVYNASNNEFVRTKTLVKSCIVQIDSTPFRQWYEAHYATPLGRKKGVKLSEEEEAVLNKVRSKKTQKKYEARKKIAKVEPALDEQFSTGRVYAKISSRPGQSGRVDGYLLEGKELDFYTRKLKSKKAK
uniref:Small ribosomal subunit protein eS8 n=1 Tax=Biomphalaria glabrata TaxID=6526 RepID=A0A2C9JF02_BIOGL